MMFGTHGSIDYEVCYPLGFKEVRLMTHITLTHLRVMCRGLGVMGSVTVDPFG